MQIDFESNKDRSKYLNMFDSPRSQNQLKQIRALFEAIALDPYFVEERGKPFDNPVKVLGHPERLKHALSGYYSRRIGNTNFRLIYKPTRKI
jgi:Txe/YoeB family toxin of Txe-Axe toxin-antitoxin module